MLRPKIARTIAVGFVLAALVAVPAAEGRDLQTVEFFSPAVDRTMKYNILLPDDYETSTGRYPVLYLLHGLTQNYTVWGLANGAPFYSGLYADLIVVMPDAGNSWYVNWGENEDGQSNNWEDHVIRDVVSHVDWNFRTIARREGRAMTGLSMGGFGAVTMGLRNPEMFISIGSTSGALEYGRQAAARMRGEMPPRAPRQLTPQQEARRRQPNPLIGIDGFSSQVERTPSGTMFETPEQADAYDPFTLIKQVPREDLPHIYLDCGTEDRLIVGARKLAAYMMEEDVPFDYMQMPGRHNAAYWIEAIGRIMGVQYEVMQRALGQRPFGRRRATN
jgi:S-formylglutathione hydrolase FrmB